MFRQPEFEKSLDIYNEQVWRDFKESNGTNFFQSDVADSSYLTILTILLVIYRQS
jgi:hypothetical protein